MSDFLALAGVTAVLKWRLGDALASSGLETVFGAQASISALPPSRVTVGADEPPQLNLYLYHVSTNAAWRNAGLPAFDSQGRRTNNPPLALDLHYLLSAYGKGELDGEILLGWAMQVLHDTPLLSRDVVQAALDAMASSPGASAEMRAVAKTTLATQMETVRITPEVLSSEDIYKLWTAFQASYRATAAYQASVVLIQDTTPTGSGVPVQTRNILPLPQQPPIVTAVEPPIVATGEVLTLRGKNFLGDSPADTLLVFDDLPPVAPDFVLDGVIRVTIPATLPAGTRAVQVARMVTFGSPGDPHPGLRSASALFRLVPTIQAPPATVAAGATLTLTVTPPVLRAQEAIVLIGAAAVTLPPRPASDPASTTTLAFPLPATLAGPAPPISQPLRLRIDGAESRLTPDPAPGPTQGQLLPRITVTGP